MMNDDIKEILERLEICKRIKYIVILDYKEAHLLLDYITNLQHTEDLYNQLLKDYDELQQENERLTNELNTCMIERNNFLSRIEKAVEYIKNNYPVCVGSELLDILNGRSDE